MNARLRLVPPTPSAQTRAEKRAELLAFVRGNVPERRESVTYRSGIVWRQDVAHVAQVLAVKANRELAHG